MSDSTVTRLGFTRGAALFLSGAGVILGGVIGAVAPPFMHWIDDLGLPMHGPLQVLEFFQDLLGRLGLAGLGALAGLAFAAYVVLQAPVLEIGDDLIRVRRLGDIRRIRHEQVAGVHRAGGKVVIETAEGRELFRGDVEGTRSEVREAFERHGYPWESD